MFQFPTLQHPYWLLGRTARRANNYLVKCRVDNETVVFVPINGAERRALHNAGQMDLEVCSVTIPAQVFVKCLPVSSEEAHQNVWATF